MRYGEALKILKETALSHRLTTEVCDLQDLVGRVSAETVVSPLTIPPFDNSAIDGFALKASMTSINKMTFTVCGRLYPGETPRASTPENQVWEIMTGAPIPLDCDACIKIEDVEVVRAENGRAQTVSFKQKLAAHKNVRHAGGDFKKGDQGLAPGEVIRADHLMALASFNKSQHKVFRKPRIVIASTGREVGEPLAEGQVVNSTRPYLQALLTELGADVEIAPTIPDDKTVFVSFLRKLMQDPPDLLVTTGAVSMGQADFVRPALEEIKAKILFHRVEIRPGRPILCAQVSEGAKVPFIIFGLPGNPVSSVIGTRFFIEPYLRSLRHQADEPAFEAKLTHDFKKPEGLLCFSKAKTSFVDGRCEIEILQGQPSFMVQPLLQTTAWAALFEGKADYHTGEIIKFYPTEVRRS
jgi:molybdopterin molybdotransferase